MVQSFERDELLIVELPYRDCNEFDNNLVFQVSVLPEGNLVQPGPALA